MSKQIKLWCCLFSMALNHSITDVVFFHWLNLDVLAILAFDSVEDFFSLQVGLLAKFGLWSFSVRNASLLAVVSTLSSMSCFSVDGLRGSR